MPDIIETYKSILARYPSKTLTKKPPEAGRKPTATIVFYEHIPLVERAFEQRNIELKSDRPNPLYPGGALTYSRAHNRVVDLDTDSICEAWTDFCIRSTDERFTDGLLVIEKIIVANQDRAAADFVACDLPYWIAQKIKIMRPLPTPTPEGEE